MSSREKSMREERQTGQPIFLDFEASSLDSLGFPIEIAWGAEIDQVECWLIRPDESWNFEDGWDGAAEKIHGIPADQVCELGKDAGWICDQMNAQLAGLTIYADGLPFDRLWLEQLFDAGERECTFEIGDAWELFFDCLPASWTRHFGWTGRLREMAQGKLAGLRWHRADNDTRQLIMMYAIASARRGGR